MRNFYYGWIVVLASALVLFGGAGARFSFGVFLKPMSEEFQWERGALALSASITLLLSGLLRPLAGWLVDRYGPRFLLIASLAVNVVALTAISFLTELWHAYVLYGLMGVGYLGASQVTLTKLISDWFVRRRGLALSVSSAGGALGELTIVPLAMFMLIQSNWQMAYRGLAVMVALIILPVAVLAVRNHPHDMGLSPDGDAPKDKGDRSRKPSTGMDLRQAMRTPAFWQMSFGFVVCGYTMSFATTHFVPFATDMHVEEMTAASALGLVGAFSIMGTLVLGALSDRYSRKYLLALVYFLRGMSSLALFLVVDSPALLYVGAFVLGISWTATTPLSSAISADIFGLKNLGAIYGTMFMFMMIGSSAGAFVDGVIYDRDHSYQLALFINVAAGIAASLVILTLREKPRAVVPAVQETPVTTP